MTDSQTLLSLYARTGSESAFRELVSRYIDLVYSTAFRLVGGDARVEKMVDDYIAFRWGAKNLFYVPPNVAGEIIRHPADFLTAAKNHAEPELSFRTGHWGKS